MRVGTRIEWTDLPGGARSVGTVIDLGTDEALVKPDDEPWVDVFIPYEWLTVRN